jgi:hypothetical protein
VVRASAWLIAGAAVLATAGVASAQERQAAPRVSGAEAPASAVPWYQRFTTSNGITESITGDTESDRILAPAWTLNQRWGVTVDVREAQRIERLPEGRGEQTSVGAYYQFTPNMRVGGELNLETTPPPGAAAHEEEEPHADVRIESAFRF